MRWYKKIITIWFILFIMIVIIVFNRDVCTSAFLDVIDQCPEYISFHQKIQSEYSNNYQGYLYFGLNIVFFLAIFSYLLLRFGKLISIKLSHWKWYSKVFFIELYMLMVGALLLVTFFTFIYDGSNCLLDNCVDVSLFSFVLFWLSFTSLSIVSNPVFGVVVIIPFSAIFLIKIFVTTREFTIKNSNSSNRKN